MEPVLIETIENTQTETKPKRKRVKPEPLPKFHDEDANTYEIGIDEAGRGPLFGRLYVAGVVLSKTMDTTEIRDSKKLTKKKLQEQYTYIQENAIVYHIAYVEANEIDKINIREAVVKGMHECACECINQLENAPKPNDQETFFLCVDGNDFPPYYHNGTRISWETFTGGDNTYASMAAASILAKVARDNYIKSLCEKYPKLSELYGMDKHMGYGTKQHLEAIRTHGITDFHRKTFGTCKGETQLTSRQPRFVSLL
jgi:ribonuclease HII